MAASGRKLLEIPEDGICPISQMLMQDPVICADGHSYERACIERWLAAGHRTSPKTNVVLPHTTLIPNINLRNMIESLTQRMPALQRQQLRQLRERQDLEAILAALAEGQEKELPGAAPPAPWPKAGPPAAAAAGRGAGAPARALGPQRAAAETNPFRRMLAEKEHSWAAPDPVRQAAVCQPPVPGLATPPYAPRPRSTSAGARRCWEDPAPEEHPRGPTDARGSGAAAARRPSRSASPFGAAGAPPVRRGPPDARGGGCGPCGPCGAAAARRPSRSASPFGGAPPAWPGCPPAEPVQWVTFGAGQEQRWAPGPAPWPADPAPQPQRHRAAAALAGGAGPSRQPQLPRRALDLSEVAVCAAAAQQEGEFGGDRGGRGGAPPRGRRSVSPAPQEGRGAAFPASNDEGVRRAFLPQRQEGSRGSPAAHAQWQQRHWNL